MSERDEDEITPKKRKLETGDDVEEKDDVNPARFRPEEVLKTGRFACVKGRVDGEPSLLLLEKPEFGCEELLGEAYSGEGANFEKLFRNDIYSRFIVHPRAPHGGVKASIVSPCTQKHVDKYRQHASFIISETAELYRTVTLKHLRQDQFDLQWVYNILSGEKEADRVIHRGDDFVLLPDLHWNGKDPQSLHALALPIQRGILSVRDLNAEHLPLLRSIRTKSAKIIKEKYNLGPEKLRLYFHYQPTFYHLHVHITYLQHDAPGTSVEKAILLDTVINNIELVGDHYQRATIPFTVRETDTLYAKYKETGMFDDDPPTDNGNGNAGTVH